ncbi:4Fe-4S dicluster domain-containing protein [Candidatus Riflebacteria bacterium]
MSHRTLKSSYSKLINRINKFPLGAPPSKLLYKILKLLFSEKEAEKVALLPIRPFTAKRASQIWKLPLKKTKKILDELAGRAILVDIERGSENTYTLPPPMAGFFEFSMMRIRGDINQKLLSELFYQYLNVEEDFIKQLFTGGETHLGRIFVNEPVLTNENATHVLDYERATQVIKTASHIGVGVCYCRHKMLHLGKACCAPMNICMTFNYMASSLINANFCCQIEVAEAMELLQQAYEENLVQFGENVREEVSYICHCCGCCCEALLANKRFGSLHPVHTTNFIPLVNDANCSGCGKCENICPVDAMTMVYANDSKKKVARVNDELCLGCGMCVRNCSNKDSLTLASRPERVLTPINTTHLSVLMAIERGKFQNMLFDNQVLHSHRALAAVIGVILRLPPIKQIMASKQVKSRYLEVLIKKFC